MAIFSKRATYALQAVFELARQQGPASLTIGEIARRQQIPERFLEAILRQLKVGGVALSSRGKEGGYSLARSPKDISLGDVLRLFGLPQLQTPAKPGENGCCLTSALHEAQTAFFQSLDAVSFEELVHRDRAARAVLDFCI